MNSVSNCKRILFSIAILFAAWTARAQGTAPLLEMAAKGTPHALNEAFIKLSKSDGAEAEDIVVAIGKSIPHHAHNFLVALKKHPEAKAQIGSLLGSLGEDYVDAPVKKKTELERRLKAIKEASSDGLYAIKRECTAELKLQIAKSD